MKFGIIQINPLIGDIQGNATQIIAGVRTLTPLNPDIILTSELALLGYPPKDMLLSPHCIHSVQVMVEKMAKELADAPPVLLGIPEINPNNTGRPLYNSAVLLKDGVIANSFHKTLLPTYDVFDEDRYFEPAHGPHTFQLAGVTIGVSICEDIWNDRDFRNNRRYPVDPIQEMIQAGVKIIVNLSASPFTLGKQQVRESMLCATAQKYQTPIVYVNQVGGNDDLIFDGRSLAINAKGLVIWRGAGYRGDISVIDIDKSRSVADISYDDSEEIWNALVLGTRDYVRKNGFMRVVIGLSGGIDSAVVAAIAAESLSQDNVLGVLMPSPYSSQGSINDSLDLASNLGIKTEIIPIEPIMRSFDDALIPVFQGLPADVTEENIQARIRGSILMAISNKTGTLVLTTGNKSELSVGYCTLYGDMCGALAVIGDLPKQMVYNLARWINISKGREIIPVNIIDKIPSAELRPGQCDQDSLPPYVLLDAILKDHIEKHYSADELIHHGYPPDIVRKVTKLVKNAEYKRKQAAPCLKVTDRAFGSGWRMPIASKPCSYEI
ncbi:MAG: NAD+ synthase [Methanomicrobiales archaeon HGW-Methanomicrobiales-4]|nr:MAG: NAD+ synthase [Methanomicrobiales archaeon HGW-Methanomicrobiales-4]